MKKKKRKINPPKPGSLVRILFTDHCKSAGEPAIGIEFEVVGRFIKAVNGIWLIRTWGEPDNIIIDYNCESFSIVGSAVISVKTLS